MSFISVEAGVLEAFEHVRDGGSRATAGPKGEMIVFADCGVAISPDGFPARRDRHPGGAHGPEAAGVGAPGGAALLLHQGKRIWRAVRKVREALKIAREREPALAIDGELQLDTAIIPAVAARKAPGDDLVAGRANILVFPDLNAGEHHLQVRPALRERRCVRAVLSRPRRDREQPSRGASVADILGVVTLASIDAQTREGGEEPEEHWKQ